MEEENKTFVDNPEQAIAFQNLRKKRKRNILLNSISVLLALGGIAWATNFFYHYYRYEITNDATIEQYITPINVRISGYVKEVCFIEHQWVNAGDTLLIIDDCELRIKEKDAEAALVDAKNSASISTSVARPIQTNLGTNIIRKQNELDLAKLNLSYTIIRAPYNGYVGRRTIEVGQFLQTGQTITSFIKSGPKWVIANYREMQISNIYIGQKVNIKVDAIKDQTFKGRITAISEATGAKYSMLPTDNSSGNFVKIQQRIPVRIDFENISEKDMNQLRVGMMVVTEAILE